MKRGVLIILSLFLLIGIVVIILLTRSRDTAPQEVTLKIWSPFDELKAYQEISKDFLATHSNVKIEFRYVDAKDAREYEAKVVDEIADGNGPDIWLIRNDWIPKHAAKSLPALTVDQNTDPINLAKNSVEGAIVDLNAYQGKLYGIPLAADSLALIYNKNFFEKAYETASKEQRAVMDKIPVTWADLKALAAATSRSRGVTLDRSTIALGTVENTFAPVDVLGTFLVQGKVSVLSDDEKNVALNLAQFKQGQPSFPATDALSFYTGFGKPGASNYNWSTNQGNPVEAFLAGKVGMLIGYHSTLVEIMDKKPTFRVTTSPMVQPVESPTGERVDFASAWTHVVNRDSQNGALAWEYLGYLMGEEVHVKYTELTRKLSALKQRSAKIEYEMQSSDSASGRIFQRQFQTAKGLVKKDWQLVDEVLQDAIKQVVVSGQSAQNSIDSASARLKELTAR